MNTLEDYAASVADLKTVLKRYRVLPHGVVAAQLRISHQRLSDLILKKAIETEPYFGARAIVVVSALNYAKARYQRRQRANSKPSS
jgi:hypothetical protein